jgi:hypothetical protein
MENYQDSFAARQAEAQASLERAQKMQQYRAPQSPGMVGRVYVGSHPMQHLAELLRVYKGGQKEKEATSALSGIATERNKAITDNRSAYVKALRGEDEKRDISFADPDMMGPQQTVTPAVAPDPMRAYEIAMQSPDSAMRQSGMTQFNQFQQKQAEEQQTKAKKAQQAQLWQESGGDAQKFLAAGGDFEFAKTVVDGQGLGKSKVARTIETVDQKTGRKVNVMIDEFGNQIGEAMPAYVPPKAPTAAPAGYRYKRDGSLEAIPGGPADQKTKGGANITEGERKAGSLLTRLRGSQQQLADVTAKNPDAASPNFIGQALSSIGMESAGNLVTSGDRQRVNAAQLDLLDAALTLGTGAAYTKEQLEGYRKSYFPQIGDSPETIRDKEERLKNVIASAEVAAGRAEPQSVPQFGPGATRPGPTPQNLPQTGRIRFDAQGNIIK